MCESAGKIIAMTFCFLQQGILSTYYIFNYDAYFLDFLRTKIPFDLCFLNLNPFQRQQDLHFGALVYEKQHKAPVKFREDRLYLQHFMLIFCLCPKSVIITTLTELIFTSFTCLFNTLHSLM